MQKAYLCKKIGSTDMIISSTGEATRKQEKYLHLNKNATYIWHRKQHNNYKQQKSYCASICNFASRKQYIMSFKFCHDLQAK